MFFWNFGGVFYGFWYVFVRVSFCFMAGCCHIFFCLRTSRSILGILWDHCTISNDFCFVEMVAE